MNISFGNMGNLVSGVVASLPSTLGNDAASMTALGDALKGVTADHLVANGFPDDLAERLESLAAAGNAGNATDAGNADVWDAYVSYMAEHPDEQAQTVAELDVVVGEMAQQPAAEEQALEQISGAAAEPGTGGGLRDLLGSEVLRNLTDKIDGITQNIANAVESAGSLTTESLQGVLTESIGAADQAGVENATQRMQEMMDSMDSLLDDLHENSERVIENLHADSSPEGLQVARADTEVVEGEPDSEVFDAYTDDTAETDDDGSMA